MVALIEARKIRQISGKFAPVKYVHAGLTVINIYFNHKNLGENNFPSSFFELDQSLSVKT